MFRTDRFYLSLKTDVPLFTYGEKNTDGEKPLYIAVSTPPADIRKVRQTERVKVGKLRHRYRRACSVGSA